MLKGQALVASAIAIAVAAIVIGAVALPILSGVNQTGWAAMDKTIYTYISTFLILALLIGAIAAAGILRR